MSNRNLLAALALSAVSSVVFAAPASDATATSERPATRVVEGKAACTAEVAGTPRQATEIEACNQYESPNGEY
jgi:hypothetical protein